MIGVAVSTYDKFEDVEILVDILRDNFDSDFYIAVTSEQTNGPMRLQDLRIDSFVDPSGIGYDPEMEYSTAVLHRDVRIFEGIRATCIDCQQAGCDYVMHLHADAWPLRENGLLRLISELDEKGDHIAVRGPGPTYRYHGSPFGFVMDQFFVYDTNAFEEHNYWDVETFDLLPHTGIHSILSLFFFGRIGISNVYLYSDMSDDRYWDGRERVHPTHVRPSVLEPTYDFVHVAVDEFPDDYGKYVQAMYLREYNLLEGPSICPFLDKYDMSKSDLISELNEIEESLDRRLRRLRYSPTQFHRYFSKKIDAVDVSGVEKLKVIGANLLSNAYLTINILILNIPFFNFLLSDGFQYFKHEKFRWRRYNGSEWPTQIDDVYRENIDEEKYPEKYESSFWFK